MLQCIWEMRSKWTIICHEKYKYIHSICVTEGTFYLYKFHVVSCIFQWLLHLLMWLYFFIGTDRPTLRYLNKHVVSHIVPKWFDIGLELLGVKHGARLQLIRADNPNDDRACTIMMLGTWLETNVDAHWNQLLEIFRQNHINLQFLASRIEMLLEGIITIM